MHQQVFIIFFEIRSLPPGRQRPPFFCPQGGRGGEVLHLATLALQHIKSPKLDSNQGRVVQSWVKITQG